MLRLGECDQALAGGVSESIRAFGIFAGLKARELSLHMMTPQRQVALSIRTVMELW